MIYFDHNATTAVDPQVADAMLPFLREHFGNASSVHAAGQRTRHSIDDARESVAAWLGCPPKDLLFTSGGTEANNLAVRGAVKAKQGARVRVVTTAVEHPSILDTVRSLRSEGVDVVELRVDHEGRLDWKELESSLTPETALVSVMWVNNETGAVYPVEKIGALCRERGIVFHVDAVQRAGRGPIDLRNEPIDLLTVSAHKIYGPKGVGALYIRPGTPLWAVQTGGHQERGRRAGTENVAAIAGFGVAAGLTKDRMKDDAPRLASLRDELERRLIETIPDIIVAAAGTERSGNTCCVCIKGVVTEAVLMALDLGGICASGGSACTAGSLEVSHVIRAMGIDPAYAAGAIRLSLGRENTADEVAAVAKALGEVVARLRGRAGRA